MHRLIAAPTSPFTIFASAFLIAGLALPAPLAAIPALPETPVPAEGLLLARDFTLDEAFRDTWSAEGAMVHQGTLLVIEADPALLFPRETAEPVLYVGSHVVQRVSHFNGSRRLVAFVPAKVDLHRDAIWFGSPELPERVDRQRIRQEGDTARAAGIVPFSKSVIERARSRGGAMAHFANRVELLDTLEQLIQDYVKPFATETWQPTAPPTAATN